MAASAAFAAAAAAAQTPAPAASDDRGFSYFMGIGAQRLTYREHPSIVPAESKAQVTNPLQGTVELPESTLSGVAMGLEFLWKL
ncbi:MAG TPA: hypothetical protein VHQ87_08860 [Rhizobacter sp.]|nr:hypothetical protein [Rhizobacter sp.]